MTQAMPLQGKTILITGGSRGIGLAAARAALARGARVALAARDEGRLAPAANELPAGGQVCTQSMDVRQDESVQRGVEAIAARLGPIDVLVNNAGGATQGFLRDLPMQALEAELQLNYLGPLRVLKAALPHMSRDGAATVVNVSSALGFVAYPTMANYSAAKAAITRLSEALEFELRTEGIGVMLFVPGHTATDAIRELRLDGPPVARPEDVGQYLVASLCAHSRRAVHGPGNRALLLLSRIWPWYARYILQHMARQSHPTGTFAPPGRRTHARPAPEGAKE